MPKAEMHRFCHEFLALAYYPSTVQEKILSCGSNIVEGESDPKNKANSKDHTTSQWLNLK